MIPYPSFITYMLVTATLIVVTATGAYLLFALIPLAAAVLARALAPHLARTPPPLAEVRLISHHVTISAGSMIHDEEEAWRKRYEVPWLPQGGWVSGACRYDEGPGWWESLPPPVDTLERLRQLEQLERLASTADLAALQ